jgi:DNA mismatch repair ATPase MutS
MIPSLQVLDGVTLSNLDVTENSSTGALEGTLLQRLDECSTPFGRFENRLTKVQIFLDILIVLKKKKISCIF